MTCNPYWDEIVAQLLPGQTPQDRPDVVARVYHAKLLDLQNFLIKKGSLGQGCCMDACNRVSEEGPAT